MDWCPVRFCAVLDSMVILFQILGVLTLFLCRSRAVPGLAKPARIIYVVAVVGLGLAGTLCGHLGSDFGLFAGLSMTGLLIAMTLGCGTEAAEKRPLRIAAQAR